MYETFRELIDLPHGIVLVTGPTGSGKTTTLYSALIEISDDTTKIITTEDPVEYQLEGINQIQVHTEDRPDVRPFAAQHPASRPGYRAGRRNSRSGNGRERDSGLAHRPPGVQHAAHQRRRDAPSRALIDMGVEPFLVASTVEAVMAQRLVRTLCTQCRQAVSRQRARTCPAIFPATSSSKRARRFTSTPAAATAATSGYRGRLGIYELLVTTERIRQLAHDRVGTWAIKQAAVEEGMLTLRQDGWIKVLTGRTTVDEVLRVTKGDVIAK